MNVDEDRTLVPASSLSTVRVQNTPADPPPSTIPPRAAEPAKVVPLIRIPPSQRPQTPPPAPSTSQPPIPRSNIRYPPSSHSVPPTATPEFEEIQMPMHAIQREIGVPGHIYQNMLADAAEARDLIRRKKIMGDVVLTALKEIKANKLGCIWEWYHETQYISTKRTAGLLPPGVAKGSHNPFHCKSTDMFRKGSSYKTFFSSEWRVSEEAKKRLGWICFLCWVPNEDPFPFHTSSKDKTSKRQIEDYRKRCPYDDIIKPLCWLVFKDDEAFRAVIPKIPGDWSQDPARPDDPAHALRDIEWYLDWLPAEPENSWMHCVQVVYYYYRWRQEKLYVFSCFLKNSN